MEKSIVKLANQKSYHSPHFDKWVCSISLYIEFISQDKNKSYFHLQWYSFPAYIWRYAYFPEEATKNFGFIYSSLISRVSSLKY